MANEKEMGGRSAPTKRVLLAIRDASTAEQAAELREADADFLDAAAALKKCDNEARFDDVYFAALARYTAASDRRSRAIARAGAPL